MVGRRPDWPTTPSTPRAVTSGSCPGRANEGYSQPNGGLICEYKPDESVESSPAVGPFLARGKEGIAVGTGNYWPGASQADMVLAFTSRCRLVWAQRLGGLTTDSPALADLSGAGVLAVVEGTNNQHGGGSVYALNGATGAVMWRQSALGEVIGGVVTADLGSGYQDVIVASTGGAEVLDGKTGAVLAILERGVGLQNCALVTDDPNGSIGVTLAGYGPTDGGVVQHYQLVGSSGANVAEAGAWPMFHHDPYLTGNAQETSRLAERRGVARKAVRRRAAHVVLLSSAGVPPYDEYHHDGPGGRGGANGQQPAQQWQLCASVQLQRIWVPASWLLHSKQGKDLLHPRLDGGRGHRPRPEKQRRPLRLRGWRPGL